MQGIAVHFHKDGETTIIKGTHLLVATGRKPNLKSLSLDRAEIAYTEEGIKVNEQLKTSNRRIYAIGDVIGGPKFTHLANYHAGIVIRNALFRLKPDVSAAAIPRVTYTDPELAQIGLTEEEAHKRFRRRSIRIYRWPYADNDRAQCARETEGFIKVITRRDGTILGCTIVGAHAGELIQMWVVAMAQGHQDRRHHRASCCPIRPCPSSPSASPYVLPADFDEGLGAQHHRFPAPLRIDPSVSFRKVATFG